MMVSHPKKQRKKPWRRVGTRTHHAERDQPVTLGGLESPPYNVNTYHHSGSAAALDTGTSVCAVFITIARKV